MEKYKKYLLDQFPQYDFQLSQFYAGQGNFGLSIIIGKMRDGELGRIETNEYHEIKYIMLKEAFRENRDWFDFELINGSLGLDNEFYVKTPKDESIPVHIGFHNIYLKINPK